MALCLRQWGAVVSRRVRSTGLRLARPPHASWRGQPRNHGQKHETGLPVGRVGPTHGSISGSRINFEMTEGIGHAGPICADPHSRIESGTGSGLPPQAREGKRITVTRARRRRRRSWRFESAGECVASLLAVGYRSHTQSGAVIGLGYRQAAINSGRNHAAVVCGRVSRLCGSRPRRR